MRTLLIVNAKLWGCEEYDSVLIAGDRIEKIGHEDRLRREAPASVHIVDADGRILLPGLTDAHMHLLSYARTKRWLDLRGAKSIDEIKRLVARKAEELGPGTWVLGRGWDQDKLAERRMPTRWDLDEAAPRNLVLLVRVCGHVAVANSLALRTIGLEDGAPDPPGGALGREGSKLNGLLFEGAVELAYKAIPKPTPKEAAALMREALKEAASYGLVELHSMSASQLEVTVYESVRGPGVPKVYFYAESFDVQGANVVGVKVFMDGSFGARTARLRSPYSDAPHTRGVLLMDSTKLKQVLNEAARRGLQVAVHAIGDEAVSEALKCASPNMRIEHASLTPPDLIRELTEARIPVSVQPHFILSDTWIVDRLGRDRARWVYAYRSLLDAGVILAGSSDAPVEPLNPWLGVAAAVGRGAKEGLPIYDASAVEALTPQDAVSLYIKGPLVRRGGERRIRPGCPADLVLVDARKVEELARGNVRVLLTLIDGWVAYSALETQR